MCRPLGLYVALLFTQKDCPGALLAASSRRHKWDRWGLYGFAYLIPAFAMAWNGGDLGRRDEVPCDGKDLRILGLVPLAEPRIHFVGLDGKGFGRNTYLGTSNM